MPIDPVQLSDLADEQATLDRLLASVPPNEWARSTPARGWTIADQVRHLAVSERAAALALAGRSDEVFGGTAGEPALRETEPAALLDAWRCARDATLAALGAARRPRPRDVGSRPHRARGRSPTPA